MKFTDILKFSWSSLLKRKFRTILTVLGVVIGCISIVVMISLGIGMKSMMLGSMDSSSSLKKITVNRKNAYSESSNIEDYLSDSVVENLRGIEHVEMVIPVLSTTAFLKSGKYAIYLPIVAYNTEDLRNLGLEFAYGSYPNSDTELQFIYGCSVIANAYVEKTYEYTFFETGKLADIDLKSGMNSIIFNTDAYFASQYPSEGTTPERYRKYTVKTAGLLAGEPGVTSSDNAYNVYCDINALVKVLRKEYKGKVIPGQPSKKNGKAYKEIYYSDIYVYVDDMNNVSAVQETINGMGYQTSATMEWIQQSLQQINIIQIALGGIGCVALLVAAIGITNTMSMSIYERTREIGIMKVIGCKINDIQSMFLMEAAYIGLLGGFIGLGISYIASYFINSFSGQLGDLFYLSSDGGAKLSEIPPWLAAASIVFSVVISVLAGYFPSVRAMKLSPLNAIKND